MKEEKIRDVSETEFEDVLNSLKVDVRLTKAILLFFIIISLFFRIYIGVPVSFAIPIILFIWFLVYLVNEYFLKKTKKIKQVYSLYFKTLFIELILLTTIIHFLGGVEWLGGIFYILLISLSAVILPKKQTRILIFAVALFYLSLVFLEFFEVIPHRTLFSEQAGIGLHLSTNYVIVTSITLIAFLFSSADMIGSFSETLREKRRKLIEAQNEASRAFQKLEESKNVLEVRVSARTKELESLTKTLEKQVKERTRELEKRLKELEKVNNLMIGRELKMVELKKELTQLKGKSESE